MRLGPARQMEGVDRVRDRLEAEEIGLGARREQDVGESASLASIASPSPRSGQSIRARPCQPVKPLLIQVSGSGRGSRKSQSGRGLTGRQRSGRWSGRSSQTASAAACSVVAGVRGSQGWKPRP